MGRNALVEFLREHLQNPDFHPNPLHTALLDLRPSAVVTTNFDDLFERTLQQKRVLYTRIIDNADLSLAGNTLQVLKPHGDLTLPDSLIFTRRDYSRYPQQDLVNEKLRTLDAQYSFLFVGYSLNDPDLNHQLQRVLDAQQRLARYHYLVIDRISPLRRKALFAERQVHVIELGSYDYLEQFLLELQTEAERIRASEQKVPLVPTIGNTELVLLSEAEKQVVLLLEEDYQPVIEAFEQLRFADAEKHLQRMLDKVQRVEAAQQLPLSSSFRDFHQRVFLALATIAVRRLKRDEAQDLFGQAKRLQPFTGKRRLHAAEVLTILGEFQETEALLNDSPEAQDARGRELLGFAALWRGDEARFRTLYPEDKQDSPEFILQRAHLAVQSAAEDTAAEALSWLDKAWECMRDFPLGLLFVAELTDGLLRRIIAEEWEAPTIDRCALLQTIRDRYRDVGDLFEKVADQYQEGLVALLSKRLNFHYVLDEEEEQQVILVRLQALPVIIPERVKAEHFSGKPASSLAVIEDLFQKGHLSTEEKALLQGATLVKEREDFEAEQLYRESIAKAKPSDARHALIEALLKLLLKNERYQEALAFLDTTTLPNDGFHALMRAMVLLSCKDQEGAIATLRRAVDQHPRNVFLLKRLTLFLSAQLEASGTSQMKEGANREHLPTDLEALGYAERLERILPSFEHRLLRAQLLAQLGRSTEALPIVEEVEKEGYVTLRSVEWKGELLRRLGRYREAAEVLAASCVSYPDNYPLRFNEAFTWAQAGEFPRAIQAWEELRSHPESGGNLYHNLFLAYIEQGALEQSAYSRAFDVAREALEKFPDQREFASLLLQAAEGSGRSREAWEIIGRRPDLQEGPYLQKISKDESVKAIVEQQKKFRLATAYYLAGGVPFDVYAAQSPRNPFFVWQYRVHPWSKGNQGAPFPCGFPDPTRDLQPQLTNSDGVLLDSTALLTLGTLNITQEVIEAVQCTGKRIFLFSGARQWLESAVVRLSLDQLPAYRGKYTRLQERLLTIRKIVKICATIDEVEVSLEGSVQQQLGVFVQDVKAAINAEAYYLDDYLPQEVRATLPSGLTISSTDLLTALAKAGVLFAEEAERIREHNPNPFVQSRSEVSLNLEKPVLFSSQALLAWAEAGLLDRWLGGESGWPPRLIVGPIGWQQIRSEVTESEIYREALQLATNLKATVEAMIASGVVKEVVPISPPDVGGNQEDHQLFASTLALLSQAREQKLILWTDDFCSHSVVDSRGPLLQEQPFLDMATRIRHAFSSVAVAKTEDIFHWLELADHLSSERRMSLLWQLHQAGYRFLAVGEVLPWLLKKLDYNSDAIPVTKLLRDLESVPTLNLPNVVPQRLHAFGDVYVGEVLSRAVSELWRIEDFSLTDERRKSLSSELVSHFEKVVDRKRRPNVEKFFWQQLIRLRWFNPKGSPHEDSGQRIAILRRFMGWLATFVVADLNQRQHILREIEDLALTPLHSLQDALCKSDERRERSFGALILSLLEPLFPTGLLAEFDPLFQRLIGYVAGFDTELKTPVEQQACGLLTQLLDGQPPTEIKGLSPFEIILETPRPVDLSVQLTPDSQPLYLSIPLLFLPLTAESSLRKRLFEHFQAQFTHVEPLLAQTIQQLLPELTAEDQTVAQKALRKFYCFYLLSFHFQFVRDLKRGFAFLALCPFVKLEALYHTLPQWPKSMSFQELIDEQLRESANPSNGSLQSQQYSELPLFFRPLQFAEIAEQLLQQTPQEKRPQKVLQWIELAEAGSDTLASCQGLAALLYLAHRFPDMRVSLDRGEMSLREWLVAHLVKILRYKPQNPTHSISDTKTASSDSLAVDVELLRRSVYTKVLPLAFRAVASPVHLQALSVSSSQLQERELIGELMMKGIVIANRLMPILLHHTSFPIETIHKQLSELRPSVTSSWISPSFRDQFDPELYGPEPDRCDIVLLGTLAVFRELGVGITQGAETLPSFSSAPFWLTQPVRRALTALASRPENAAERQIREAREQGVPNRLQTFLNRTPQEYAADLLQLASPKHAKGETLVLQGQAKLREILQQVSDPLSITSNSVFGESDQPELLVRISLKGEEKSIAVEVKSSAAPRQLHQVIGRLNNLVAQSAASYGILVVPAIAERSRKICEENNVGYVDLQGNAFIKFDGVFIKTSAQDKGVRKRGRTKSLFAPISTRLIRVLLAEPQRAWKLQELNKVAHLSLGQTHKVKQELLNQEFIDSTRGKGLFLKDASGLLNAWQQSYSFDKNSVVPLFSLDKISVIEEKIRQYCEERKIGYAVTLFSGASKLAQFVRYNVVAFYFAGDQEELRRDLNLKAVDSGANVLLLSPYDEGVWYGLQESQGYKIVSTIQLYLDLYSYGGRGREQAEFVREKLLSY